MFAVLTTIHACCLLYKYFFRISSWITTSRKLQKLPHANELNRRMSGLSLGLSSNFPNELLFPGNREIFVPRDPFDANDVPDLDHPLRD